ncbi:DUF2341 domain-containing protein [Myxococcota bacterium]
MVFSWRGGSSSGLYRWCLVLAIGATACQKSSISWTGLACEGEECLPGWECHPERGVCAPEVKVACGEPEAYCPITVETGDSCTEEGAFLPCAMGVSDCSAGCRTCEDGQWSECTEAACTLGEATSCGRCDDDCTQTVHNATAICVTSGNTYACDYSSCGDGFHDINSNHLDGCECGETHDGTEICDGVDNDCDRATDNMSATEIDDDCNARVTVTEAHVGTWSCNDACVTEQCASTYFDVDKDWQNGCEYLCDPGTAGNEICDGEDNDCDGGVDDVLDLETDCDGQVSNPQHVVTWQCGQGTCEIAVCDSGWTNGNRDPDDGCEEACEVQGNEICDEDDEDEDCDGIPENPGAPGCMDYYRDDDDDAFGLEDDTQCLCEPSDPYDTTNYGDCDDRNPSAKPGGSEICDPENADEDCDGTADDADADGADGKVTTYVDNDSDTFGDENAAGIDYCDPPVGSVDNNLDCDDALATVHPDAVEGPEDATCTDTRDNDCDGNADLYDSDCVSDQWAACQWRARRRIVIHHEYVLADLTDFPALISLTSDADLASDAQDNGNDLAFANQAGTRSLSHDIEHFDGNSGRLVVWVEVPSLSSTEDTVIYMYYDNPTAFNQEDAAGTWSSGYEAVYHLHDDFNNSAGVGREGSNNNSTDIAALIGDGQMFDPTGGDNAHVDLGAWSLPAGTNQITLEAWVQFATLPGIDSRLISKAVTFNVQDHVFMLDRNHQRIRFRLKTGTEDSWGTSELRASSGDLLADTWYLVAGVYDGSDMFIHLDGNEVGRTSKTGEVRRNGWDIFLGDNPSEDRPLDGVLDEARISSVSRSREWLRTEYNNGFSPDTFATMEPEVVRPEPCL